MEVWFLFLVSKQSNWGSKHQTLEINEVINTGVEGM